MEACSYRACTFMVLLFEAMALTLKAIRMSKMLKKSMKSRKSLRRRGRNWRPVVIGRALLMALLFEAT